MTVYDDIYKFIIILTNLCKNYEIDWQTNQYISTSKDI